MTKNNVLDLIEDTLNTEHKLSELKDKRKDYKDELQKLQTKYLIEFNKVTEINELNKIKENLNQEIIILNQKYFGKDKVKA